MLVHEFDDEDAQVRVQFWECSCGASGDGAPDSCPQCESPAALVTDATEEVL